MCLIITTIAALVSSLVWYFNENTRVYNTGKMALMYWGAAFMWSVDSIFSVVEGGPFFDISLNDTALGMLIFMCGIVGWLATLAYKKLTVTAVKTRNI